MEDNNRNRDIVVGLVAGLAAGFVAGILLAPKSGKETRDDIKRVAGQAWAATERQLKRVNSEVSELLVHAKDRLGKATGKVKEEALLAIERAKSAQAQVREVLSAIRHGEADDEDLNAALQEVREARDYLRSYLEKSK